MKHSYFAILAFIALVFQSCFSNTTTESKNGEVNIYTHRSYSVDQHLFEQFEKETGIKVNLLEDKASALMNRIEQEGENTKADILVTVDVARLVQAKKKGLFQQIKSPIINENIPAQFRDEDGFWVGLTKRARVVVYSKERVNPDSLSSYEDLTNEKWKNKIAVRPSSNIYNQSLMASIIANNGDSAAVEWAIGVVNNMSRQPKGNDRDQIKEVAAGLADLAIVNTYYLGKLLNSKNAEEVKAAEQVAIFFPNGTTRGTHVNVSGIGVTKYAKNKENAVKLIEFLTSVQAQEKYAQENYEYPVNPKAKTSELLQSWGEFKEDPINLSVLGELNERAVNTFNEANWH